MTKQTSEDLDYPINQQLLEDATKSMEEWRIIKDRLQKIEEHRDQVAEPVLQRVRKDYEGRLAKATELLLGKKQEIDHELMALRESRKKINSQLEVHRHALEEVKFRNTLGEFNADEYREKSKSEEDKIGKFETVLNAVDTNIHRYESIFAGEAELFAVQDEHAIEEDISEVADEPSFTPASHEAEPPTDEAGYVLDEKGRDYFSSENVRDTDLEREESATARAAYDEAAFEKGPSSTKPRIVVLGGENAGAAFPIKGTMSFGRADSSTVPLKDVKASRQHAQIQKQGTEYILVDLNSSNGTFVNGEKIDEHVLSNGDEILIGDTLMQFQMDS